MSEPQVSRRIFGRIGWVVAWYDLWVGLYWNGAKRRLYILPLPCVGLYIDFPAKQGRLIVSGKETVEITMAEVMEALKL